MPLSCKQDRRDPPDRAGRAFDILLSGKTTLRAGLFLLALLVLPFSQAMAGDANFLSRLADVPLMSGLRELLDDAVVFDKPEGLIVEAVAVSGTLALSAVEEFYSRTLPGMGWVEKGSLLFDRQGQRLRLIVEPRESGGCRVSYLLFPVPRDAAP